MDIFNLEIILDALNISINFTIETSIVVLTTIFLISCLINAGAMKKISGICKPIIKNLGINPISITSMLTCFFSPLIGYSILSSGLKENKIEEKEVIASSLLNSFPSVLSHTLTFFLPFVVPILGFTGFLFVGIKLGTAFIKSILGFTYLSLKFKKYDFEPIQLDNKQKKDIIKQALKSTFDFSKRLIPVMIITMFILTYLSRIGAFEYINQIAEPITTMLNIDPNIGIVAITSIANMHAGIIMAGGFLETNILTTTEVIAGLILGNVISFSTKYVKHSIPLKISLFGAKLGTKITLINAIITLLLDVTILLVLLFIF